ncbi:MAG TPA: hypothetical protein VM491_05705, partial [Burkholderiaceae bacterium]|nr:hypothetical protein [Burkholderiaceae bacterium]
MDAAATLPPLRLLIFVKVDCGSPGYRCGQMNDITRAGADRIAPAIDPALARRLHASGLAALRLGGRELLPIVQGGMG